MNTSPIIGRASTPPEKRAVIDRIHAAWCAVPGMRLGQLIANACGGDAFYTEDTTLAELCETFAKEHARSTLGYSIASAVPSLDGLDAFIFDFDIDRAALGMLAAAEMVHERAALAKCDRPERAVGHEMYALERSLVEAAGVDPIAWEKARGA